MQFVIFDPRTMKGDIQPFPCRERRKYGVGGIFFEITDALPPLNNSLCLYAGKECTFDGVAAFIEKNASFKMNYRFATSGLTLLTPSRVSQFLFPSAPILDGKVVIVGDRKVGPSAQEGFRAVLAAVDSTTWIAFFSVLLLFAILHCMTALAFGRTRSFRSYVQYLLGDPSTLSKGEEKQIYLGEFRLANRLAIISLRTAFSAFMLISILFYEISVVNYLFIRGSVVDVEHLSTSDLSEYIVPRGAEYENVWRKHGKSAQSWIRETSQGKYSNSPFLLYGIQWTLMEYTLLTRHHGIFVMVW